ncbi:MAG: hypothetical protein ACXVGC_00200 [Mycobacteriaceae bacterium]
MPRAPKQCGHMGCPELVVGVTYCAEHEAERQATMTARRGNFRQRGYDSRHDREAKAAKAKAIHDRALCPRCGQPILAGQDLDYGHSIARANQPDSRADRVEHAHCNRSAQHR